MPVPATQHRATTGTHQNKLFENNRRSNITHTSVINRGSQHVQRDQYDFPLALTHVGKSPDAMSRPAEQLTLPQSTVLLCLQLLSQIRPGDNPLSSATGNSALDSGRDIIPSFSRNAPHSDNSGSGFSTMLNPVANALYEAGEFIARHDPLRFPVADASPAPLVGKKSTIYGSNNELQQNDEGKYEIIVHNDSGVKVRIPVYMEPRSKTWHQSVYDGCSVFNDEQKKSFQK